MPMCYVFGCNHQGLRDPCSFYHFPKDIAPKWEKLCRRKDRSLNIKHDVICSCHFKDGRKSEGPTLFPWNKSKYFDFPEQPSKKRKVSTSAASAPDPAVGESASAACCTVQPAGHRPDQDHLYAYSYAALAEMNLKLKEEVNELQKNIEELTLNVLKESKKRPFTLNDIAGDEKKMLMYTSLKFDVFQILDSLLQRFKVAYVEGWTPSFISRSDQLLMTLMKLTMNTPLLDLAERFCTTTTTVNNIFTTHICLIHEVLYEGFIEGNIPSLNKCKSSMPASFGDFSCCRLVIDATEISQDVPGNDMKAQSQTYSSYKNNHTVKSVTGVAPNAAIVYISKLYPGSTSDVAIVEHSRMLDQMKSGDMILADKGFTIHKLLPPGVQLNIPPFLLGKSQFSPEEVKLCRKIGRSRIHVERANERIKNYAILLHIPHQYRYISTKIFQDCCALVNFQDTLLQEIAKNYSL